MNKFSLTICFCLSFLFLMSCERPDLADELNADWSSVNCTPIDDNMWSPQSSNEIRWDAAVDYCNNLTACGYSDWKLPSINELRTLIKNCSKTETDGNCGVTDSCLSYDCRNDTCGGCKSGGYSKLGDTDWFWSSSTRSDNTSSAWCVGFDYGRVDYGYKYNVNRVRCVR